MTDRELYVKCMELGLRTATDLYASRPSVNFTSQNGKNVSAVEFAYEIGLTLYNKAPKEPRRYR